MLIVVHYSEIALKGGNRKIFEEKLVENIKKSLSRDFFHYIERVYGRILVEIKKDADIKEVKKRLSKVFGIAYFAVAVKAELEIENIKEKAIEIFKNETFNSFKVETKRGNKNFALTSQQINEKVGEAVLGYFTNEHSRSHSVPSTDEGTEWLPVLVPKVKMENPDIVLCIEITEKNAFLYTEKIAGLGGLPVGVGGRALCLLSGGIDSPVAAFLAMKRGLSVDFLHFHSYPYTNQASIDKVKDIVKALSGYQPEARLFLAPFADIQKEILLKTKSDLRVILYRRLMLMIAEQVAIKNKMQALVTGENLGQVASQTLQNMAVIESAIKMIIIRPLLCDDKIDIIEKAKKIGTFDISIMPHQDCCARFLPEHPETKANLKEVEKEEKKLKIEKLAKCAFDSIKIEVI